MTDARLALFIYRSEPSTAVFTIEQFAQQWDQSGKIGVPRIPSWVLIWFSDHIPKESPYSITTLIERAHHDVELAYWLHTAEAWRIAMAQRKEEIGKQLIRPRQYGVEPLDDLEQAHSLSPLQVSAAVYRL